MKLFPAIDLLDGACVRLTQGDYDQVESFSDDPLAPFWRYIDAGAKRVHVVDLNAAKGQPHEANTKAVKAMVEALPNAVQIGGGIRSVESVEHWLALGAQRVIVGTVAAKQPEVVRQWCQQFPGQIVLGIDVLDGRARTQGWKDDGGDALALAQKFVDVPSACVLCTNIAHDGMLNGPDAGLALSIAKAANTEALVSGGVATLADLETLVAQAKNESLLQGVVVGRALLSGAISLEAAINLCS